MGNRGREPHPALGRCRAGLSHWWGSLTALRRQPAPHLDSPSPRPRGALIGGCGECGRPSPGAANGTDRAGTCWARHRRLGCGSHLTAATTAAVGTPGGRIAPPGLSRTARIRAGPAGGAPVTARGGSGRPSFSPMPATPGGDEYQHAQIYNSCARDGAE